MAITTTTTVAGGSPGFNEVFSEIQIPEQKEVFAAGKEEQQRLLFPTVLAPPPRTVGLDFGRFVEAVKEQKPRMEALLREKGAVLFRGYPVATASDFDEVIEALGYEEFPYVGGGASRHRVVGRVFTANEAPPEKEIPVHHETGHLPEGPSTVLFFCEVEPRSGGETPVMISNVIYETVANKYPEFCRKLEEHGVLYKWFSYNDDDYSHVAGRSWQTSFSTKDRSVAEERAKERGMKLEWKEKGAEATMGPGPAFRLDERRGKTWHNNIFPNHLWRCKDVDGLDLRAALFGDGTPMPADVVEDCKRMADEACAAVPWKKGDVLLLDNHTVVHSRRPFEPPRRILAFLGK